MAAITPFVEMTEHRLNHVELNATLVGLGEFGTLTELPPLSVAHANLTRTVWIRRLLEQALSTRRYTVVQATEGTNAGELVFRLDRALPKNEIPWMPATRDWQEFALWGEAGKMACPTWDLPAGALEVGGACPGADAGQTVVTAAKRLSQLTDAAGNSVSRGGHCGSAFIPNPPPGSAKRIELREKDTICGQCYALEGQYPSPHVQAGEIIRYWWCQAMFDQGRQKEWVETMVRSMQLLRYPLTPQGIMPVRLHSSGDFFSIRYAEGWIEVANRLHALDPRVTMWAPTRTWAAQGWGTAWPTLLGQLRTNGQAQPNLVVRASAYHVGDAAPTEVVAGNAKGSTSLLEHDNQTGPLDGGRSKDPRYEWNCQVYALEGKVDGAGKRISKTCENADNPEGGVHCRVCWAHPELRVNYTTH